MGLRGLVMDELFCWLVVCEIWMDARMEDAWSCRGLLLNVLIVL